MNYRLLIKADFLKNGSLLLTSQGESMLPVLYENDYIFLKKISFGKIKVNDIISFMKGNKTITHRVIYKTNKYLVTKGDNNLESDGKIYPKQIIGKVFRIKRNGKIVNLETLYLLQSTFYFQEIIKMKRAFEKERVEFVFLKGLPLHLYFEKTHPRRIYADCDVLINKKDFEKAQNIILEFGYKKSELKNKQVENNYFKIINNFTVIFDLHLEPAFLMTQFSGLEALYPQKLTNKLTEDLLNNKQKIKINNEQFFILNTRYLILYLALHIFHHNFRGSFRYQFLDKVIRKSRLSIRDWQNISLSINSYQLSNFVYPVFILLRKYYKTPFPHSFLLTMKQWNNETINRYLQFNIFDDESRFTAGINRFKLIFILSPHPLWRKIFVFTNPHVVYYVFRTIFFFCNSTSNSFKSFLAFSGLIRYLLTTKLTIFSSSVPVLIFLKI